MEIVRIIENHENNISNLNDIIESIREYLDVIQKKHRYRDEHNRSDSMKHWLNIFISCKLNLSNEMVKVSIAFYKAKDLYKENEKDYQEFKDFIKEYTQTIVNIGTFQSTGLFPTTQQTNSTNIYSDEIWDKRNLTKSQIISNFWDTVQDAVLKYNTWVANTESALTLKHYDMGYIEGVLRGLFQEQNLAYGLYKGIKDNKFYQISIPASLSNNILNP